MSLHCGPEHGEVVQASPGSWIPRLIPLSRQSLLTDPVLLRLPDLIITELNVDTAPRIINADIDANAAFRS